MMLILMALAWLGCSSENGDSGLVRVQRPSTVLVADLAFDPAWTPPAPPAGLPDAPGQPLDLATYRTPVGLAVLDWHASGWVLGGQPVALTWLPESVAGLATTTVLVRAPGALSGRDAAEIVLKLGRAGVTRVDFATTSGVVPVSPTPVQAGTDASNGIATVVVTPERSLARLSLLGVPAVVAAERAVVVPLREVTELLAAVSADPRRLTVASVASTCALDCALSALLEVRAVPPLATATVAWDFPGRLTADTSVGDAEARAAWAASMRQFVPPPVQAR